MDVLYVEVLAAAAGGQRLAVVSAPQQVAFTVR
jgi:hypothetical protein